MTLVVERTWVRVRSSTFLGCSSSFSLTFGPGRRVRDVWSSMSKFGELFEPCLCPFWGPFWNNFWSKISPKTKFTSQAQKVGSRLWQKKCNLRKLTNDFLKKFLYIAGWKKYAKNLGMFSFFKVRSSTLKVRVRPWFWG